jgi:hypothetical protein
MPPFDSWEHGTIFLEKNIPIFVRSKLMNLFKLFVPIFLLIFKIKTILRSTKIFFGVQNWQ